MQPVEKAKDLATYRAEHELTDTANQFHSFRTRSRDLLGKGVDFRVSQLEFANDDCGPYLSVDIPPDDIRARTHK